MSGSRIVVFRPGALGDTIVTADALAAIRARFPHCSIELVGNASAGALLQASGLVDVVTSFDSLDVAGLFGRTPTVVPRWRDAELVVLWLDDAERIAEAFRAARATRVIVATPRLGVDWIEERPHPLGAFGAAPASPRGSGETSRWAASAPGSRKGSRDVPAGTFQAIHISDYLVATLRPADVSSANSGPALVNPAWPARAKAEGGRSVLLHPGSGSPMKNWPANRFAALATRFFDHGRTVRMLSGPADRDAVAEVRALIRGPEIAVEEPADILALAEALMSADLYIGNDSGVSHLSARLGVPTVAVFGATDPREWAPRGPRVLVIGRAGTWPTVEQAWDAALALTGETTGDEGREAGARGLDARAAPKRRRRQRAGRARES